MNVVRRWGVAAVIVALVAVAPVDAWYFQHNRLGTEFYGTTVKLLDGSMYPLAELRQKKVVLIINVASKSSKSEEYFRDLAELNYKYGGKGLAILAVPCDQFGDEPGTPQDIMKIAGNLGHGFKFLEKSHVNGDRMSPLYKVLRRSGDENINASFASTFLVQPSGDYCQINRIDDFLKLAHHDVHNQLERMLGLAPSWEENEAAMNDMATKLQAMERKHMQEL